jgi:hypothetical protein
MKWIGQHIWDFISRFRSDVYLEKVASDAVEGSPDTDTTLALKDGKIVRTAGGSGGGGGNPAITDNTIPVGTGTSIEDSGLFMGTVSSINHLSTTNNTKLFFHTKDMNSTDTASQEFVIRSGMAYGTDSQESPGGIHSDTINRITGQVRIQSGGVANWGEAGACGDSTSGDVKIDTGLAVSLNGTATQGKLKLGTGNTLGNTIEIGAGGADDTIKLDGDIIKIGKSTHTDGYFLQWDNTNTKAVWAAGSGGITTHAQDAEPTGLNDGDIWIDTNDDKKLHRYNGSSWVDMRDTSLSNVTNESKATMFTSPTFTGTVNAVGIRSDYFSGASTQPKWELGTNIGNYLDIKSTSHIKMQLNDGYGNSSSEFSILDQAGDNIWSIDLSGNIKTKGKIRDNNGNDKIDVNTSGQTDFTGNIKVKGSSPGFIYGPDADELTIESNKDLVFTIDADNDDNGKKFIFKDASTEVASLSDRGDLQIDGTIIGRQRQVFNMSFHDDLGTTKHYMPWSGTLETSANAYQEEVAMAMPCRGRIISCLVRTNSITGNGDLTIGIQSTEPGELVGSSWDDEESEVMTLASTDDNHAFNFVFGDAIHFNPGDLVAMSIQGSSDLSGYTYWYVTTVVEFDWNNVLGVSSAEYDSGQ